MNFKTIFNGMVGKDFIKAFNDNFTITDETFLSILATLLYKVKSSDIKEFKIIDGVVSYTTEDEPTSGEDDREWIPVDITKWGNISGDITEQTDLNDILNDKAAVETVETLSNLVSTINQNLTNLTTNVAGLNTKVSVNTSDIADIEEDITTAVHSTNIKALRLNNAVFQWSPDGKTWYEQPIISSISWGKLVGDINNQEDLISKFDLINNSITEINTNITGLTNSLESLTGRVSALEGDLSSYKTETTATIQTLSGNLSTVKDTADSAYKTITEDDKTLKDHIADTNNPHKITAQTIGLGNVNNTSDTNKPLSTPQKTYVDNAIKNAIEGQTITGLVGALGNLSSIFVGTEDEYSFFDTSTSILGFLIDESMISAYVRVESTTYKDLYLSDGTTKLTADVIQTSEAPYYKIYYKVPFKETYYYGATVEGQDYQNATQLDYTEGQTLTFNDLPTSNS